MRTGDEVLQLDGITVRDKNGVVRVDNVTLTVDRGEIVGVAGVEGNGQTEIGLVLAGLLAPTEGPRLHRRRGGDGQIARRDYQQWAPASFPRIATQSAASRR